MIHNNKRDTATGHVFATVEVEYNVPKKGDIIGDNIEVLEDFNIGVNVDWDGNEYVGSPTVSEDGSSLPVFYGKVKIPHYGTGQWSWRFGDSFTQSCSI